MADSSTATPKARWYFWDGGFLAAGRGRGVVPPHAHHAIQMVDGLDDSMRLRGDQTEWHTYEAAAVKSDVTHAFDSDGVMGCLLLIDPETREGRWLQSCLGGPIAAMLPDRIEATRTAVQRFWVQPPDAAGTTQFVEFVVRQFGTGMMPAHTLDERVADAIEHIQALDARVISLEAIAKRVFLSASRFAHLFSDEVGIPFRRYLLWRRLTRAILLVSRGSTLSRAAHAAGFSDSAHFTRTFYQMFGIPPSAMLNQGEMYEIPAPFELARAT